MAEETLYARADVAAGTLAVAPRLAALVTTRAAISTASTPGPVREVPGDGPAAVLGPTEAQKGTKAQGEADRANLACGIFLRVLPGNIREFRTPESVRWCWGSAIGSCRDIGTKTSPALPVGLPPHAISSPYSTQQCAALTRGPNPKRLKDWSATRSPNTLNATPHTDAILASMRAASPESILLPETFSRDSARLLLHFREYRRRGTVVLRRLDTLRFQAAAPPRFPRPQQHPLQPGAGLLPANVQSRQQAAVELHRHGALRLSAAAVPGIQHSEPPPAPHMAVPTAGVGIVASRALTTAVVVVTGRLAQDHTTSVAFTSAAAAPPATSALQVIHGQPLAQSPRSVPVLTSILLMPESSLGSGLPATCQ